MNTSHNTTFATNDDKVYVITIGRQWCSGAREIAKLLSERLGIAVYDKEVLSMAAQETGLGKGLFEHNDEKKGFFRSFMQIMEPFIGGGGDFYNYQLSDENLFMLQSRVIQRVASERSCIFIGRAADYILRNHPRHVSIFIAADMKERIKRLVQKKAYSAKQALEALEERDEQRSAYYNFYSSGTWGTADTYDMCINSSILGIEKTVDFIEDFIKSKLEMTTQQ